MRGITARRFLRVKTCVQREKHVKTVQKCMREAPKLCEAARSVVFYVSKRVCSMKNT